MKISVDERDLYSYLDIEYYIKEREYLINQKEYLLLLKRCQELGMKQEQFVPSMYDQTHQIRIDGVATFIFPADRKVDFYCWSNVIKNDDEPRHRELHLNHEDLKTKEDINAYLEERNHLVNGDEDGLIQEACNKLHVGRISFEAGQCVGSINNQTSGVLRGYFKDYDIWTNVSYFSHEMDKIKRKNKQIIRELESRTNLTTEEQNRYQEAKNHLLLERRRNNS